MSLAKTRRITAAKTEQQALTTPAVRVTMSRDEGAYVRKRLTQRATKLGHDLKPWKETRSNHSKFVASCRQCGALGIMYESTPVVGDDITGDALLRECRRKE